MSEKRDNSGADEHGVFRIDLEDDPSQDWNSLLEELENSDPDEAGPAPAAQKPAARKTPAPKKPEARTPPPDPREETPAPAESASEVPLTAEERRQAMMDHYGEILTAINTAMNQLRKFEERHPYLIAPNIFRVWEDGLKESSLVMFREFQRVRNRVREETHEESGQEG